MPPRGKARPDADRQKAFVEGLARSIVAAERAAWPAKAGRSGAGSIATSMRTPCATFWASRGAGRQPVARGRRGVSLQQERRVLDVSYVQIARFMDSADHAMRLATAAHLERPAKTTRKLHARDERVLRNWWPRERGSSNED